MVPVGHGRKRFPGELGVRRRLVPADAAHRLPRGAGWKVARLPGGRAGPAGAVGHERDGLLPRDRAPILHERELPQFPPVVAARLHEPLELGVGRLVPVHEIVAQLERIHVLEPRIEHVEVAAGHAYHLRGNGIGAVEPDHRVGKPEAHQVERAIAGRLDPEPVGVAPGAAARERQQDAVERRPPK